MISYLVPKKINIADLLLTACTIKPAPFINVMAFSLTVSLFVK